MIGKEHKISLKEITIYFILSAIFTIFIVILLGNPLTRIDIKWYIVFIIINIIMFYIPVIFAIILNQIINLQIIKTEHNIKILRIIFNAFAIISYTFFVIYSCFSYSLTHLFD